MKFFIGYLSVYIFMAHTICKSTLKFQISKFIWNIWIQYIYIYSILFSSAWISKKNVYNYLNYKNQFENKNQSKSFKLAIKEIEFETNKKKDKITLKDMPIDSILNTFNENFSALKEIYKSRVNIPNRFNIGPLDYLSILYRAVTMEQQHNMYDKMIEKFIKDEETYTNNRTVNLRFISKNISCKLSCLFCSTKICFGLFFYRNGWF